MYDRIKKLRLDNGLTQSEVARMLQCSQQVYSGYELGRCDIPTEMLVRIAAFYNANLDYILGLTDVFAPYPDSVEPPKIYTEYVPECSPRE